MRKISFDEAKEILQNCYGVSIDLPADEYFSEDYEELAYPSILNGSDTFQMATEHHTLIFSKKNNEEVDIDSEYIRMRAQDAEIYTIYPLYRTDNLDDEYDD